MSPPVAYDVTRLLVRTSVSTPNGIDRIDLAYARHFLGTRASDRFGLFQSGLKPAVIESHNLASVLAKLERKWAERGAAGNKRRFLAVKAAILGLARPDGAVSFRSCGWQARRERLVGTASSAVKLLSPRLVPRGLLRAVPTDAVFIHTTHYPFASLFRWLDLRPDVRVVFFIHDLLPLQYPEYFEPRHTNEHRRAMDIFARYGHGAIVNTQVVEHALRDYLRPRGRPDLPILVAPIPPDAVFTRLAVTDHELWDHPYFVMVGTIEPRKNHLTILQVWRELARQAGKRTPKLVIIGGRGWENENVVDLLDRSVALRDHVIEVGGLSTADVACLVANARALLMPSFAEGYGLPVVEARALGTPVIASDIPVFREVAPDAILRHPLDGKGWHEAVQDLAGRPRSSGKLAADSHRSPAGYFARVESFVGAL